MEKVSREEVLNVVKQKGPCLPREVVRTLGKSDTFMVGAVLSELIQNNQMKVTNTKIGTSPNYYVPGQEPKLVNLSKHLNQKDKRAYELLNQKKVLRDSQLEPIVRVSLRSIKDFSVPLEINVNKKKEIFWKWYLLSNNEAIEQIKSMFGQKPKIEPKPIKKEIKKEVLPKIEKKQEKELPREEFNFKKPEEKKTIEEQTTISSESEIESTEFLITLRDYFKENNIIIEKEEQIKKKTEYDFIIKIPSAFGRISFFCKAKSKKKNNESDVAAAYLAADEYRLPTIFLTTGEFTKKAEKELERFKNITIKQI